MITYPNDSLVICDDCHQTAVQREVDVRVGADTRRIVYQTHHADIGSGEHQGVNNRIDAFHGNAAALRNALRETPADARTLECGILEDFDIVTVKPSACKVRTDIKPVAIIRVHYKRAELGLDQRPLEGQDVAVLLNEFREVAGRVALGLKEQFDKGR